MSSSSEEYIDYSCSTPLERLTRDVETTLRKWHVDHNDRHVSVRHGTNSTPPQPPQPQQVKSRRGGLEKMNSDYSLFSIDAENNSVENSNEDSYHGSSHASVTGGGGGGMGSKAVSSASLASLASQAQALTTRTSSMVSFHKSADNPEQQQQQREEEEGDDDENDGVSLIRSTKLTLTTNTTTKVMDGVNKERCVIPLVLSLWDGPNVVSKPTQNENLPKSLQRSLNYSVSQSKNTMAAAASANAASDLSSLFGIGQHITLTPYSLSKHSDAWVLLQDTVASISSRQMFEEEEEEEKLFLRALAALSTSLQACVNVAASNCECRIPMFGLWGCYTPSFDEKKKKKKNREMMTTTTSPMMMTCLPKWLTGGRHWEYGYLSSNSTTTDEEEESDNEDVNHEFDNYQRRRQIIIRPTNTSQKTPFHLLFGSNKKNTFASNFIPPILSGYCHPTPCLNSIRGFFNIVILPPGMVIPFHCTTLHGLGALLLSRCPSIENGEEKKGDEMSEYYATHVVVTSARHLYSWRRRRDLLTREKNNEEEGVVFEEDEDWRNIFLGDKCLAVANTKKEKQQKQQQKYQSECKWHAISLLERAHSGSSILQKLQHSSSVYGIVNKQRKKKKRKGRKSVEQPMWGPDVDPVYNASCSASWGTASTPHLPSTTFKTQQQQQQDSPEQQHAPPILSLPLRVRSNRTLSPSDIIEMERTIQHTIFDPYIVPPSSFYFSFTFDKNAACKNLSASNRCLLAALIRACTLDGDALPGHLLHVEVLEELGGVGTDEESVEVTNEEEEEEEENEDGVKKKKSGGGGTGRGLDEVASWLSEEANLGVTTTKLVAAMDWSSMADSIPNRNELMAIVKEVLDGWHIENENEHGEVDHEGYPSPPVDIFQQKIKSAFNATSSSSTKTTSGAKTASSSSKTSSSSFQTNSRRYKTTPIGRLLSIFFAHMPRLHTPSAMMSLWLVFVEELRSRWYSRESLSNLGYVPGLDDVDEEEKKEEVAVVDTQLGQKADYAAFVNSSEPNPDRRDCLIGQWLQVFNIGIECIIASEALELQRQQEEEQRQKKLFTAGGQPQRQTDEEEDRVSDGATPSCALSVASTEVANNITAGAGGVGTGIGGVGKSSSVGGGDSTTTPTTMITPAGKIKGAPTATTTTVSSGSESPLLNAAQAEDTHESSITPRQPYSLASGTFREDGGTLDRIDDADEISRQGSSSTKDDFFDTMETPDTRSLRSSNLSFDENDDNNTKGETNNDNNDSTTKMTNMMISMMKEESAMNVTQRQSRRGARCPVHGVNLIASGDQLYAPYLQRTPPLTDDILLQRRVMLANTAPSSSEGGGKGKGDKKKSSSKEKKSAIIQSRITIAHRLQKPKLLSDMRSFKAANPGAVFQDFTNWYGNPGNPLEEYESEHEKNNELGKFDSKNYAKKSRSRQRLDAASEAIQILMAIRTFWSDTWDEATPCPASEQQPLFDAFSTVEMLLHSFETMHPAHLILQILAVNFATANFVLRAYAGPFEGKIELIERSLKRLDKKTDVALEKLAKDMMDSMPGSASARNRRRNSSSGGGDDDDNAIPVTQVSAETISSCEEVCNAIGEVELLLSRATSLLHKFPGEHELVQTLLRKGNGEAMVIDNMEGRRGILNAIKTQQQQIRTSKGNMEMDDLIHPSVREYLLRNCDDDHPCQLNVQIGDTLGLEEENDAATRGGLLLAFAKCEQE